MATVYPISSAMPSTAPTSPTDPTADTTSSNQLNENTFLTLLVAQLKYQDPMNPADSTQFLTQTAQFTEVETLQKIEAEQSTQQSASQVLAASTMIGRPVTYSIAADGSAGTPTPTSVVSVRGSLPSDASIGDTATASTDIFNAQGAKVPLDLTFTKAAAGWTVQASTNGTNIGSALPVTFDAAGDHTINDVTIPSATLDGIVGTSGSWPSSGIVLGFGSATDPTRVQLSSGPATIGVAEQDGNDGQSATGIVTGVHMTSDGPQLVIAGQEIPYTSVTDVAA